MGQLITAFIAIGILGSVPAVGAEFTATGVEANSLCYEAYTNECATTADSLNKMGNDHVRFIAVCQRKEVDHTGRTPLECPNMITANQYYVLKTKVLVIRSEGVPK